MLMNVSIIYSFDVSLTYPHWYRVETSHEYFKCNINYVISEVVSYPQIKL